jgi:hypothetical protein
MAAMRKCAAGRISNGAFWREFCSTWSGHESRFQGAGLEGGQFGGKRA